MSFQFQPIELSGQSLHYTNNPTSAEALGRSWTEGIDKQSHAETARKASLQVERLTLSLPISEPKDVGDLSLILAQLSSFSWSPGLSPYVEQIKKQINLFIDPSQEGGTPQNNLPSLQAFVHLYVKPLFDSWIYQAEGVTEAEVKNLLAILKFDDSFIPALNFPAVDELPPAAPGMIPYLLKNLKMTDAIVLQGNSGDIRYEASALPLVNGVPYLNIPYGYSGRLCISNGKNADDFHTWPFLELTITADGQVWTNFTGVDAIALLPMTLQRVGDNERKSLQDRDPGLRSGAVGINRNFATVQADMAEFYKQNDTTAGQRWLATMNNANGSIKSGKNMNDPVITAQLSSYLTIVANYFNENNLMYFIGDGNAGMCSGYFSRQGDQWIFLSKNPQDSRTFSQTIPQLTNIGAWISGGEGDWDISPITHDSSGKDTTDWNQRNANWGVAKALSGLVNTGVPYDRIGTQTNPMGGGNWVSAENIANRGKPTKKGEKPFYNLYAEGAQKAVLCNAYVSDFGDDLGADGTLVGKAGDNDCVIVTLYY